MIHKSIPFVLTALLAAGFTPEASAGKRPKFGVFGTVNGKSFNAPNVNSATDPCASGIYQPGPGGPGSLVFQAIECRGKRRRQGVAVKKHYKNIVMTCSKFDWNLDTTVFPWEMVCGAGSVYAETRTGRYGVPLSTTMWGGSNNFSTNPPTGSLTLRIDSVDGNVVRGAITGTFDTPVQGAPPAPAPIAGELRFAFPFRLQ